jgi:S1-C subfamily serine protease
MCAKQAARFEGMTVMSNVHGQPDAQGPAQPESQSPQPGAGFPAGPGYPPGAYRGYADWAYPPPPEPPRRPRRRHRMLTGVAAAGAAFVVGAGVTAWAAGVPGTTLGGALSSHRVLSTESIVQMTDPSVVNIVSQLGGEGAESAGTGIVLTSSGEILTNNHVIDGATSIRVTDVGNGESYSAKVVGYDATHDVAVLKLTGAAGLKTATLGNSSDVSVGQKVVALGNAGGQGGEPKVAAGQVTGLDKAITAQDEGSGSTEQLTNMIRTNADIQPGDSGGPLTNTAGQVVGIDTAAGPGQQTGAVQAFAIPIDRALTIANKIAAGTSTATIHIGPTAFLGVEVSGAASGAGGQGVTGATIAGVVEGGAAAQAGLTGGDTITSVGGHAVTSPTSLRNTLAGLKVGAKVSVTWQTELGQSQTATVTLGSGPAA